MTYPFTWASPFLLKGLGHIPNHGTAIVYIKTYIQRNAFWGEEQAFKVSSKNFILKFCIGFICCWWFFVYCFSFFEMKNKHLWIKESCFCREFSRIHKLSMKITLQKHNDFNKIKQSFWSFALCCQNQRHVS